MSKQQLTTRIEQLNRELIRRLNGLNRELRLSVVQAELATVNALRAELVSLNRQLNVMYFA